MSGLLQLFGDFSLSLTREPSLYFANLLIIAWIFR